MRKTGYYVQKLKALQQDLINDQAELDKPNRNKTETAIARQLYRTKKTIDQAIDWITDNQ